MNNLFWTLITVLLVLWLAGQIMSFGGPFIHTILVVVAILVVYNLVVNRRATLP